MRVTAAGWLLVVLVAATVVLALVAPGASLVTGVAAAILLVVLLSEGIGDAVGWWDVGAASERKREVLGGRLRLGRRRWERTAPDEADEHPDAIWERERERRRPS